MITAYVSVGSNLNRHQNIRQAVQALTKSFGGLQKSPVYESEAVGFDGPPFLNLVVAFEAVNIEDAVAVLRQIENQQGRIRTANKFRPRSVDLDLLLCDDGVIHGGQLPLPRSEITQYAFVLKPLQDIAPEMRHPTENKSMRSLWATLGPAMESLSEIKFDWCISTN